MATAVRLTLDATTPVALFGADSGVISGGNCVLLPQATGTIVVGPSDETTSTGARLAVVAGAVIPWSCPAGDDVYLLASTGTLAVDVLRYG